MKQKDELEKIDGCRVLVDNLPTILQLFKEATSHVRFQFQRYETLDDTLQ